MDERLKDQGISQRIFTSEDMSERMSENMSERMSENMSERVSENMSERVSEDIYARKNVRIETARGELVTGNYGACAWQCKVPLKNFT